MKIVLTLFFQLFCCSLLFSKIDANYINNQVELRWTTPNNVSPDYFIIERSKNGRYFKEIMRIKCGKSHVYYYEIDYNPPNKIAYYRIKGVNNSNVVKYFNTVLARNYNKLNNNRFKKSLKGFEEEQVLMVLRSQDKKEYYIKIDVVEYKKQLVGFAKKNELPSGKYFILATSEDLLLNKSINIQND